MLPACGLSGMLARAVSEEDKDNWPARPKAACAVMLSEQLKLILTSHSRLCRGKQQARIAVLCKAPCLTDYICMINIITMMSWW